MALGSVFLLCTNGQTEAKKHRKIPKMESIRSDIPVVEVTAPDGSRSLWAAVGAQEYAQAGGLIGYGVNLLGLYRRAAYFVDKILKGAKPADLPVEQPTRFELVINLKTAKTLGLEIASAMLVRADEIIE